MSKYNFCFLYFLQLIDEIFLKKREGTFNGSSLLIKFYVDHFSIFMLTLVVALTYLLKKYRFSIYVYDIDISTQHSWYSREFKPECWIVDAAAILPVLKLVIQENLKNKINICI